MGRSAKITKGDAPASSAKIEKPAPDASPAKKVRKKRRRKLWKSEIRRLQKTVTPVTMRAPFERLVREIMQQHNPGLLLSPKAFEALWESSETAMVELFQRSNLLARGCGGREGILIRDFQIARSTLQHLQEK